MPLTNLTAALRGARLVVLDYRADDDDVAGRCCRPDRKCSTLNTAPAADVNAVLTALGLPAQPQAGGPMTPQQRASWQTPPLQLRIFLWFAAANCPDNGLLACSSCARSSSPASSCCSPSATRSSSRSCHWLLPWRGRFALARAWSDILLGALRVICGLGYRVEGRENIPADRACIALVKHSSSWGDPSRRPRCCPAAGVGAEARAHVDSLCRLGHTPGCAPSPSIVAVAAPPCGR